MDYLYYLESMDTDKVVASFLTFDKQKIKNSIIEYLKKNPEDQLTFYKVSNDKKYVGDDVIDFYGNNGKGIPSKIVTKGNREIYKPFQIEEQMKLKQYINEEIKKTLNERLSKDLVNPFKEGDILYV